MKENLELSQKIETIVGRLKPKPAEISFALINLNTVDPEISGYKMDTFIYPASVYKAFVAAEILRKVDIGKLTLEQTFEIPAVNEVDRDYKLFPKNSKEDHRPLLKSGDKVSIDYLLDLVFSRSDNTAANMLVDIATREDVNEHIILANGWNGSEVTRKFLDRSKEVPKYQHSAITVSNARHLAEFMYKIEKGELVSKFVSDKLKEYMLRRYSGKSTGTRAGLNTGCFKEYYGKGGWLVINGYKYGFFRALKNVFKKGHAVNKWSNDASVITGVNSHYALAILTLTKSKWPWTELSLKKFSEEIYNLMET
jgi:hypothetical protein